ncbi:GtrA family protein [Paracoccus sp. AK26]|uniref:GtrA family protein n=1 Tax=Paracoccus sp. AK26 TaxID=2589076 RepID=UPI0014286A52|nr:GtrA family protein [Paracoccus sp. AK26]
MHIMSGPLLRPNSSIRWRSYRGSQHALQFVRFIVSLAVGLLSNMAIMAISVHAFKLDYQTGFLLALILVPMLSFMINRSWVFREPQRG